MSGAALDTRDCADNTPAHLAAMHGNVAVLRRLLGRGAAADARSRFVVLLEFRLRLQSVSWSY